VRRTEQRADLSDVALAFLARERIEERSRSRDPIVGAGSARR